MAQADSQKSIFYALGANLSIAVAKSFAAFFTQSGAMLAEAIHSFADSGNQLLLLFGLKSARKPPNPDYPLGFGRSTFFWSFIVALVLFSVGGLFSMYEGWHKLQEPQPLAYPWVAIGVLTFGIVAESISMWGCVREVNKIRDGRSYFRWFRESRQSELLVIFGEDLAALLGLVFALLAIAATMVTGNPIFDAIGTIGIGVLLIVVAIFIGIETKALLIGQGVEKRVHKKMLAFLEAQPQVDHVYNLLTMQLGNDVMVAVKARMVTMATGDELIRSINHTESGFKQEFPQVLWLFFEPDNTDGD